MRPLPWNVHQCWEIYFTYDVCCVVNIVDFRAFLKLSTKLFFVLEKWFETKKAQTSPVLSM
jgi:hypothetical protein